MKKERIMILEMLEEGKISADDAAKLLETLERNRSKSEEEDEAEPVKGQGKFFRVTITDTDSGKTRANIRIPLSVMGIGAKFGAHFAPQIDGLDNEDLLQAVRSGEVGKIIDVFDDEDGEHVEVYIE
jgi:hypothetical protein